MIENFFIEGVLPLLERMALVILTVLLFSRTKLFRKAVRSEGTLLQKALFSVFFGVLAVYGTLRGIKVLGAIANIRDLAPLMAGVLGGPVAGTLAGIIGGVHRFSVGGFTAIPCSLATILAGLMAGVLSKRIGGENLLAKGTALAVVVEVLHMALILVLARPFSEAMQLVGQIALPMIVANAAGMLLFLYLFRERME
jgi:sigma-B regulation protein RsbU (phosphoserine phosphatase)